MRKAILSGKGTKQQFAAVREWAKNIGLSDISFGRTNSSLAGKGLLYARSE